MKIKINNLDTYFEVYGKGKNVLILHGWGDSSQSWQRTAEYLAVQNRVFILDLPGFGNSEKPPNNWNTTSYVNFVENFIKSLEIDEIILLGHSFGGKIASGYAGKYPKTVKKLILVAAQGLEKKSFQTKIKIAFYKLLKKGVEILGLGKSKHYQNLLSKFGSPDYQNAGRMRRIMVNVVNDEIESQLGKIKAPTMIVWGDKDEQLSLKTSKEFKKKISNSFIKIVWGASHFPQLEDPKTFHALLFQFINENR